MVLETSANSMIERQICNVLRKHFLEQRPITWRPVKIELVINTELTDEFLRKSFHFLPIRFFLSIYFFPHIRLSIQGKYFSVIISFNFLFFWSTFFLRILILNYLFSRYRRQKTVSHQCVVILSSIFRIIYV